MSTKQANAFADLRKRAAIAAVAVCLVSLPTASFGLGSAAERAACTPDVFRLCAGEIPNVGRIIACMKARRGSLSAACRSVFDRYYPKPGQARTAE
ncbi:MAG TPA: hypothetical protein VEK73_04165 [Xanthobacteraceae bacterium]|nr:hypothetical protein [Xanthobacteraceae bacterium]